MPQWCLRDSVKVTVTGQLADMPTCGSPTRGLIFSWTGQLTDSTPASCCMLLWGFETTWTNEYENNHSQQNASEGEVVTADYSSHEWMTCLLALCRWGIRTLILMSLLQPAFYTNLKNGTVYHWWSQLHYCHLRFSMNLKLFYFGLVSTNLLAFT